jgi:hypothetical protein
MHAIGAAHWDRGLGGRRRHSGRAGGPRRRAQSHRPTGTRPRRTQSRTHVVQTAIPAQMPFGIGRLGSARAVKREQKTSLPAIRSRSVKRTAMTFPHYLARNSCIVLALIFKFSIDLLIDPRSVNLTLTFSRVTPFSSTCPSITHAVRSGYC